MEEKLKQSMMDEIEGQIIKPDEINMNSKGTLDQEQYRLTVSRKQIPSEAVQNSNYTQRADLYFRRMRTRL